MFIACFQFLYSRTKICCLFFNAWEGVWLQQGKFLKNVFFCQITCPCIGHRENGLVGAFVCICQQLRELKRTSILYIGHVVDNKGTYRIHQLVTSQILRISPSCSKGQVCRVQVENNGMSIPAREAGRLTADLSLQTSYPTPYFIPAPNSNRYSLRTHRPLQLGNKVC